MEKSLSFHFESTRFQILTYYISYGSDVIPSSVAYAWSKRIFPVSGEHHGSLAGSLDKHFKATFEQVHALARLLEKDLESNKPKWTNYADVAQSMDVTSIFPNMQWEDRKRLVRRVLTAYLMDLIEVNDQDSTKDAIVYLKKLFNGKVPSFTQNDAVECLFLA